MPVLPAGNPAFQPVEGEVARPHARSLYLTLMPQVREQADRGVNTSPIVRVPPQRKA